MTPYSGFASMFSAAMAEVNGEAPPSSTREAIDVTDREECCEDGDEECVVGPSCSITFVDESCDDGEDDCGVESGGEPLLPRPPMDPDARVGDGGEALRGRPGAGASAARAPPAPSIAPPACAMHATIEVCTGKACTRGGAQEVMSTVRADLPKGWDVRPVPKCMGMCKQACVVRVTSDFDQVVHTGVSPMTAAITVLPGRSYPVGMSPMVQPAESASTTGTTAGARMLEAAVADVAAGGAMSAGSESGNGRRRKKPVSAAVRAAKMASQKIGSMDIAVYDMIDRR